MFIEEVQQKLLSAKVDGWLLYDFHGNNPLARSVLRMTHHHLTRRWFYWIPLQGRPIKLVHSIELGALDHLPGDKIVYLEWEELHQHLHEMLKGKKRVAMEYSPNAMIPYVSCVDGGTIDLIRAQGVEVTSSASFLQYWTCRWSKEQLEMHRFAADVLDRTAAKAWSLIREKLNHNSVITDYDVQQFIRKEIEKNDCVMNSDPMVAANAHAADPHYTPTTTKANSLKKGDLILIDLWCKKNHSDAVYADITRVAVADAAPSPRQQEIFQWVRKAQTEATLFVKKCWGEHIPMRGYEVDQVCRNVIKEAGYGKYFTHRTGHNIHMDDHGPGANMDSLESYDERLLIPETCFSIEPGIYIPGEIGIRLEYDVYLNNNGTIDITGGVQEELEFLLRK